MLRGDLQCPYKPRDSDEPEREEWEKVKSWQISEKDLESVLYKMYAYYHYNSTLYLCLADHRSNNIPIGVISEIEGDMTVAKVCMERLLGMNKNELLQATTSYRDRGNIHAMLLISMDRYDMIVMRCMILSLFIDYIAEMMYHISTTTRHITEHDREQLSYYRHCLLYGREVEALHDRVLEGSIMSKLLITMPNTDTTTATIGKVLIINTCSPSLYRYTDILSNDIISTSNNSTRDSSSASNDVECVSHSTRLVVQCMYKILRYGIWKDREMYQIDEHITSLQRKDMNDTAFLYISRLLGLVNTLKQHLTLHQSHSHTISNVDHRCNNMYTQYILIHTLMIEIMSMIPMVVSKYTDRYEAKEAVEWQYIRQYCWTLYDTYLHLYNDTIESMYISSPIQHKVDSMLLQVYYIQLLVICSNIWIGKSYMIVDMKYIHSDIWNIVDRCHCNALDIVCDSSNEDNEQSMISILLRGIERVFRSMTSHIHDDSNSETYDYLDMLQVYLYWIERKLHVSLLMIDIMRLHVGIVTVLPNTNSQSIGTVMGMRRYCHNISYTGDITAEKHEERTNMLIDKVFEVLESVENDRYYTMEKRLEYGKLHTEMKGRFVSYMGDSEVREEEVKDWLQQCMVRDTEEGGDVMEEEEQDEDDVDYEELDDEQEEERESEEEQPQPAPAYMFDLLDAFQQDKAISEQMIHGAVSQWQDVYVQMKIEEEKVRIRGVVSSNNKQIDEGHSSNEESNSNLFQCIL